MLNARIGNNLQCQDGKFVGKKSNAFSADNIAIECDVFFSDGFASIGTIRLLGAHIGGDLSCNDGKFDGKDGDSLNAERMRVEGVFLLVIPSQTGPNSRGFGHEALPVL
jgi:hypothetical protein